MEQGGRPGQVKAAMPIKPVQQRRSQGERGRHEGHAQAQRAMAGPREVQFGEFRQSHFQFQPDHHGARAGRQRFTDAPHTSRQSWLQGIARAQLLAIAAYQEKAIIGARPI